MKKWFNKISLKSKWIVSFSFILILPIIMNFISYMFFFNTIQQEINKMNLRLYNDVSSKVNIELSKYKKIGVDLGANRTMQDISNLNEYSQMTDIQKNNYEVIWNRYYIDFIASFMSFVYFDGMEMVADINGFDSVTAQYQQYLTQSDVSVSEWKAWLANNESNYLYIKGKPNINNKTPNYLAVKHVIYENRRVQPTVMVVVLREDFLVSPFKDAFSDKEMQFEVIRDNGNIIATTLDDSYDNGKIYEKVTQNKSNFKANINKKNYLISSIYDSINKWYYIFYTPTSNYYMIANMMNLVFATSLILSLIFGIVLINRLVKNRYYRVKRVLGKIPGSNEIQDEYSQIEQMLQETIRQENKNSSLQQKKNDKIFGMQMIQIFNGISDGSYLEINTELKEGYNTIIAFSVEDYVSLFKNEQLSDIERYNLMLMILSNIGQEIFDNKNINNYFIENNIFAIMVLNAKEPVETLEISDCVNAIIQSIELNFGVSIKAYISRAYNGINNLYEAYSQAMYCSENNIADNGERITFYEDIEDERVGKPVLTVDDGNKLNNFIRTGDSQKAKMFVNAIIDSFLYSSHFSNERLKYYINDIISHILRNFSEDISDVKNVVDDIYMFMTAGTINVKSVKEQFNTIIDGVCDSLMEDISENEMGKTDKSAQLVERIKSFIEHNYSDENLSCDMIAKYCKVSNSYISRIFKNIENDGILNYINKTRINNAKRMLKESDKKIEDIATEVGIINVNTFIRLFKKYEGVTPGAYRRTI